MKNVAVLGATGMAGHVIALFLEEQGYNVYRMSRSIAPSDKNVQIDATDFNSLIAWLEEIKPDVIVNSIGILQKEADARPDLAIQLNAYLPRKLEQHFKDCPTKLIHLSTDCVFSGATGGYTEDSFADGMTMYDRSKALGEVVNEKDLTFRMSIIGPDTDVNGTGLFNWFMKQQGVTKGYSEAIWNGVTTIELSKAIDAAIKQNISGLYHLTPNGKINKYDLLCLFQKEFEKKNVEIVPFDNYVVDKTLINTRTDFDHVIPTYPDMIKEMAVWVKEHKGLYHYE
ncbi:dTDP-4-dehydrorhamnose reductase [Paenibacillus sp. UNCCL117]|uniref:dTDP-4-dehydrorhamnose reductase family protein n=1 Tax=unclassified Paenibacillus TaxID=185978 RepID=UPI00088FB7B9|nr:MULTISPECIES: SDR family oxidoreductase [unclassified Paenibacillus]SDD91488.1 dTDP-4-dehydrorhamnose reductase [Paenibacillus sp. cl123]SFW43695.1 dTDP-4-dehydrorhamnose reductase [Paenibacillus sp. UNCCL117]